MGDRCADLFRRLIRKAIVQPLRWLERATEPSEITTIDPSLLEMVWPKSRLDQYPAWIVPEQFLLRTYQDADKVHFFGLMDRAGFPGWNDFEFGKWLIKILPDGLFFLENQDNHEIAATAMAVHNPSEIHPFGASLSCVAVEPVYQGNHLGRIVTAAVLCRLLRAGYREIYLETNAWRLPAIKTYFQLGWVPLIYRSEMAGQWQSVCQELDWPYTPESWGNQEAIS